MRLINLLGKFIFGRLGKITLWNASGLIARALLQAGYLVIVSRSMGAEGYGAFAGLVAIAILLYPLCGWGISYFLTQKLSINRDSSRSIFVSALSQTFISGLVLLVLMLFVAKIFFSVNVDIYSLVLLGAAELLLVPLALITVNIALVYELGGLIWLSMCLVPLCRLFLVCISVFFVNSSLDLRGISELHFYGTLLGAVISLLGQLKY